MTAAIVVERRGPLSYSATLHYRPEREPQHAFESPVMERGPYDAATHRRAWRKAWRSAGCPTIVDVDEL